MISVIIPVYNVEKYLPDCLESVLKQTYTDLEIILVDDGSTDTSGKICDEYGERDSRIQVIHKANSGVSDARNIGIEQAQGEYIGFVDSDDLLHPCMYEYLHRAIEEYEAEIASCDYLPFLDGETVSEADLKEEYCLAKVENREQYLHNFLDINFVHYVVKSLYKKGLLEKLRFASGKRVEDVIFNGELSSMLQKRAVIKNRLYFYRLRQGSIMHSSPEVFLEHIAAMEHNIKHFEERESTDFVQKYVEYVMSLILTKRVERRICGTINGRVNKESFKAFCCLYDKYGSSQKTHLLARYAPVVYDLLKAPKVKKYLH